MYKRILKQLLLSALVTGAIPSVLAPVLATPPIEAYGKLPAFEDAAISPSGGRVAMVATVDNKRNLIVFENGSILKSATLGDVKVRDIE